MNILGFIKESKWFQRTTYGEIYLDIEINEKEEITFRVNAGWVKVEWGDGEQSETKGGRNVSDIIIGKRGYIVYLFRERIL